MNSKKQAIASLDYIIDYLETIKSSVPFSTEITNIKMYVDRIKNYIEVLNKRNEYLEKSLASSRIECRNLQDGEYASQLNRVIEDLTDAIIESINEIKGDYEL